MTLEAVVNCKTKLDTVHPDNLNEWTPFSMTLSGDVFIIVHEDACLCVKGGRFGKTYRLDSLIEDALMSEGDFVYLYDQEISLLIKP